MDDSQIVELYWSRDEGAIRETERKYGKRLAAEIRNFLGDPGDCQEVVNDVCLRAWGAIPPARPEALGPYLAKIARRLAIDRLRARGRARRVPTEYEVSLSELEDCLSGGDATAEAVDGHLLGEAVNRYLGTLTPESRGVFLRRYFYAEPVRDIARRAGLSQGKVKTLLFRARQGLRDYLKKEGFDL